MLLIENATCKVNGETYFGSVECDESQQSFSIRTVDADKISFLCFTIDEIDFASFENDTDYITIKNGKMEKFWFVNPKNFNRIGVY